MSKKYRFYVTRLDGGLTLLDSPKDIEAGFGCLYSRCEGLGRTGKARFYTEEYADSDEVRAYFPGEDTAEAFEMTLTVEFIGESRADNYRKMCEFLSGGRVMYYDTARCRVFIGYLSDGSEPKEDVYKGSVPYIEVAFKFKSLYGRTFPINPLTFNPVKGDTIEVRGGSLSYHKGIENAVQE